MGILTLVNGEVILRSAAHSAHIVKYISPA